MSDVHAQERCVKKALPHGSLLTENIAHMQVRIEMVLQDGTCDAQSVLRDILGLLVQANLHEERDVSDDAVYGEVREAEAHLFCIATEHVKRMG